MNTPVFGPAYAAQYDALYSDKDYEAECDLLEQAFHRYADGPVRSVLDLGCGTGNHALPLARRGYQVTGVDLAAAMLDQARQKSGAVGLSIAWLQGDVRDASAGGPFDAALIMFAVLGYLVPNADVLAALANARRHLRPGGILAFDVWYGPAVLTIRPSERIKVIPTPEGKIIRAVSSQLDTRRQTCDVRYRLWRLRGNQVEAESEELHVMRYFFPLEIELLLSQTGFTLASLTAFPTLDQPVSETTWNALGVARAI